MKKEKGFSLVEVLVAIVILTVAVFPIINHFSNSIGIVNQSGKMSQAVDIAKDIMELLKNDSLIEVDEALYEYEIKMNDLDSVEAGLETTVYDQINGYDLFTDYTIDIITKEITNNDGSVVFSNIRYVLIKLSWSDSEFVLDSIVRVG